MQRCSRQLSVVRSGGASRVRRQHERAAGADAEDMMQVALLDVASQASVRSFAAQWTAARRPLHVLINNAGIFSFSGLLTCKTSHVVAAVLPYQAALLAQPSTSQPCPGCTV